MQARAARAHHHGRRTCSRARPRRARNPSARAHARTTGLTTSTHAPAHHHCIHCPLLRGDPRKQNGPPPCGESARVRAVYPASKQPLTDIKALWRVAYNSALLTAFIMARITAVFERTSRTHHANARLPQPPTNARTLAAATPAARATRRQPGARAHQPPPSPALVMRFPRTLMIPARLITPLQNSHVDMHMSYSTSTHTHQHLTS